MANQGVGPWQVTEAEPYTINEVFRQIEEQVNLLRGLGVSVSLSIAVHAHSSTASGGKLDHGGLLGLLDNDHPQYLLASTVTTDQALEEATDHDRISDELMVGTALLLTEQADGSGDAVKLDVDLGTAATQAAAGDHTHTEATDVGLVEGSETASHISDEVMVDATLTLTEQADGSGDAIQLKLADTAVTPGTYGDASNVTQLTVDQQGRLTSAANVAIVVTATEANDIGFIDANEGDTRITDELFVGEDLALIEPGEQAGDSIFLDVATAQTLDDGQGGAAQGFETVVDGLGDFGIAIDSTGRPHLQGQNRFRYLNSIAKATTNASQTALAVNSWATRNFATESFDTDGIHEGVTNPSRLTFPLVGKWLVAGTLFIDTTNAVFAAGTTNGLTGVRILLNGGTVTPYGKNLVQSPTTPQGTVVSSGVALVNVTATTDYVEIQGIVVCSSGTFDMTDSTDNAFEAFYVGE